VAAIDDGVRFGYFDLHIACEVVNGERRRVTMQFSKKYQFVIPKDACERPGHAVDSRHGSDPPDHVENAGHRRHGESPTGSATPTRAARAAADA
jgi:hypothetical protein